MQKFWQLFHKVLWWGAVACIAVWGMGSNFLYAQILTPDVVERQLQQALSPIPNRATLSVAMPSKCATLPIFFYQQLQQQGEALNPQLATLFDVRQSSAAFSIISPRGYFRLFYDVVGPNAVPPADTLPANGIPDYVERAATYLDSAWIREFVDLGFKAPPISPPNVLYEVYFKDMNVYGYTTVISRDPRTYIVLENDFSGFPPNTDPEGHQLGALKVTIAHELKHASQYVTSRWSEGNWVELDATHMEDVVFNEVNDYYNYLAAEGSPLMSPTVPLDEGGGGSYEDCIWHHYLAEKFGITILRDFWQRRAQFRTETVLQTYDAVLSQYGSTLAEAFAEFSLWNWFTGSRAQKDWGYREAPYYPTAQLQQVDDQFPVNFQVGLLKHLSSYLVGLTIPVQTALPIVLERVNQTSLSWQLVQQTSTDSIRIIPMFGDTTGYRRTWIPERNGQLIGMVISNGEKHGDVAMPPAVLAPPVVLKPQPFLTTKQDTGYYPLQCQVVPYFSVLSDSSVQLIFSVDSAGWDTLVAIPGRDTTWFTATLPALPHGSRVKYYWLVVDTAGTRFTAPLHAPENVFRFDVVPDTTAPEITVIPVEDPAITETPLMFQARILDELSAIDTAWVEIENQALLGWHPDGEGMARVKWEVDTTAILPGDSVRYRWVARDSEGNQRVTPWHRFYWTRWITIGNAPQIPIPDAQPEGIRDTIMVKPENVRFPNPVITRMQVMVEGNHSWIGDLVIQLTAPDNHTIRLMDHPGSGNYGSGANGPRVVFADSASVSIQDITHPRDSTVSGVYRPFPDRLQTFQGLNPVGQWVLTIQDDSPGDEGMLQKWQLRMKIRPFKGILTAIETRITPEASLTLLPNYPNPFNGSTLIAFRLGAPTRVNVAIYNILGQRTRVLMNNQLLNGGWHRLFWNGLDENGKPVPSGVYILTVRTPDSQAIQKVLLLR